MVFLPTVGLKFQKQIMCHRAEQLVLTFVRQALLKTKEFYSRNNGTLE
jgi:hypothetical protein